MFIKLVFCINSFFFLPHELVKDLAGLCNCVRVVPVCRVFWGAKLHKLFFFNFETFKREVIIFLNTFLVILPDFVTRVGKWTIVVLSPWITSAVACKNVPVARFHSRIINLRDSGISEGVSSCRVESFYFFGSKKKFNNSFELSLYSPLFINAAPNVLKTAIQSFLNITQHQRSAVLVREVVMKLLRFLLGDQKRFVIGESLIEFFGLDIV